MTWNLYILFPKEIMALYPDIMRLSLLLIKFPGAFDRLCTEIWDTRYLVFTSDAHVNR